MHVDAQSKSSSQEPSKGRYKGLVPIGALFLVGAVALLTGSVLQLAGSLDEAGVCKISNNNQRR